MVSQLKALSNSAYQLWMNNRPTQWGSRVVTLVKSPYGWGLLGIFSAAICLYQYGTRKRITPTSQQKPQPDKISPSYTLRFINPAYSLTEVSKEEVMDLQPLIQAVVADHPPLNLQELDKHGQLPSYKMIIDGTTYHISKPFLFGATKEASRLGVLVLVKNHDTVFPIIGYLAQTGAIWKYAPQITKNGSEGFEWPNLNLGQPEEIRDTHLPTALSAALSGFISSPDYCKDMPFNNYAALMLAYGPRTPDYKKDVKEIELFKPTDSPDKGILAHLNSDRLQGFAPNFNDVKKCEFHFYADPIYGSMIGRIYHSVNGRLRYLFCEVTNPKSSMIGKAFLASIEILQDPSPVYLSVQADPVNRILRYGVREKYDPHLMKGLFSLMSVKDWSLLGAHYESLVSSDAPRGERNLICTWNIIREYPLIREYYQAQGRELPAAYPKQSL